MYSLLSMHAVTLYGFPNSLSFLTFQGKKAIYNIGGFDISLLEIEHAILRGSTHHPSGLLGIGSLLPEFDVSDPRSVFTIKSRDPRVGFCLCFCTKSNPRPRIFTEENLYVELDRSVVAYLDPYLDIEEDKKRVNGMAFSLNADIKTLYRFGCPRSATGFGKILENQKKK